MTKIENGVKLGKGTPPPRVSSAPKKDCGKWQKLIAKLQAGDCEWFETAPSKSHADAFKVAKSIQQTATRYGVRISFYRTPNHTVVVSLAKPAPAKGGSDAN